MDKLYLESDYVISRYYYHMILVFGVLRPLQSATKHHTYFQTVTHAPNILKAIRHLHHEQQNLEYFACVNVLGANEFIVKLVISRDLHVKPRYFQFYV